VRNAEEFVCLTFLGFIQNIVGRLRTLAMTIVALFFATTIALSTYPFDPRQVLSAILIALFAILGIVIVKVYAEMHRDATLSHVTNTKTGELGPEFWFKVLAFGFAPLVGLLTRIFPGISDFIFSWIQPSISSLK
jgi:fumarate reductase subunit D